MSDNDFSDANLDDSNEAACDLDAVMDDGKKHARAQHNALERRRRDNIKDMYTALKDEIPNFNSSERASRAHVLKRTHEHIEQQKAQNQSIIDETRQLDAENEQLRKKIAEHEAVRSDVVDNQASPAPLTAASSAVQPEASA